MLAEGGEIAAAFEAKRSRNAKQKAVGQPGDPQRGENAASAGG